MEFLDWLSSYTDSDKCLTAFKNQLEYFRVNYLKISKEKFENFSKLKRSKTAISCAFSYEEKIPIGKTWEYFLGYIYPQSLPSILVSEILEPKKNNRVLDVCSSPGSKFSHIAMIMENTGVLVGNDYQKEKISPLYSTINRMNVLNCIVTIRDGRSLGWKDRFDKVLVDAPCSALGSNFGAINRWKEENSKLISQTQKMILKNAYNSLKNGGELVYSTCTYAKEENEVVVKELLENSKAELVDIKLDLPHEKGLGDFGNEFRKTIRIYPQHLQSEGFFISKIKKVS